MQQPRVDEVPRHHTASRQRVQLRLLVHHAGVFLDKRAREQPFNP